MRAATKAAATRLASTLAPQQRRGLASGARNAREASGSSSSRGRTASLVSGAAVMATTAAWIEHSSAARTLASAAMPTARAITAEEPLKLYQYDVCPFCNKAQTFLEFHAIPHERIEVNPLTKAEIKFSSYRMVPFAMVGDTQINGSGEIIKTMLGEDKPLSASEEKWFQWVDDHLVHVLPANIYRSPGEALQAFDYITNESNFSAMQKLSIRYAGALAMFMIAKRSKKKYNLSDDPRQDLFEAVDKWAGEGLAGKRFHSGSDVPDTADLAVFGVLRSIEGNYGTWKDLSEKDLAHKDAFWTWYKSVKEQVETNRAKIGL
ncbi:Prostaglandin E synthase 2 [Hondaea fermentalgiana]|uniref:Prostaglandin E synthase 2 n=1 Tax=Hondaea fermentalgiana TaxID=2315210 RepID=A0A2R5GLK2_9STRA|nr:Prostaglandin E synthase 2 [Hondaea fermentalgiana]|eukprot:GBG30618.1 Prostaglandin E synthase 2 [Hondaea fermentalgiana]